MQKYFPLIFLFFILACKNETVNKPNETASIGNLSFSNDYVGDKQCIECHNQEFKEWQGSHHDLAMQIANDSTVLGNFNDVEMIIDGVTYFFTRNGNDFIVKSKEIDGTENTYTINYTFGVTPLQQYLVDFGDGKKQVLRVTWDAIEKKWYHQYSGDSIDPHDWMHWTGVSQNWNTMCAECHSTNLEKNYNIEADTYNTTYSSINVSCESCHGPAEKHVNWAKLGSGTSNENVDTYIASPNTQLNQMNSCAPCHARRTKLTQNLEPNIAFEDQYVVQNISTQFYHGDGQILGEDYVYGSFLQSQMYHEGVTCTNCHNPHTLELKAQGNNLCMQCHEPKYDTPNHYFHEKGTESSQCINCHMTGKMYMGNDFRRDHSFRIPRPDQSVIYNTPNACNQCHSDKSNSWAAKKIVEWYGTERENHFSDHLLLSNKNQLSTSEIDQVNTFINDLDYPAIARATAIDNIEITNEEQYETILKSLDDPSPLVRYNALGKFNEAPPQLRVQVAAKHISDSTKMVRIRVAELLTDIDVSMLTTMNQSDLNRAQSELLTMLQTNADFATGRVQLGDYYFKKKQYNEAIYQYREGIKKDSLFLNAYPNLATVYSIIGNTNKSLETLNLLISKAPDMGHGYYLRGLLYFELNKTNEAVADLEQAAKLDPSDSRSLYNIATFYYQNKDYSKAEQFIQRTLKIEPENKDYQYLLALIFKEQGRTELSNQIMQTLQ